jgi:putative ABC transport system permease protein
MDWKSYVRDGFAGAEAPDEDVIEELAHHAESVFEQGLAAGESDQDARRRVDDLLRAWRRHSLALRRHQPPAAPPPPAAHRQSILQSVVDDVAYATRMLRRQPRYATLVTLIMALGIGAATMVFSVGYGVLVRPLPWPQADRLISLIETRAGRPPRFGAFSNAAYLAWVGHATTIQDLAAWAQRNVTLADGGEPERIVVTTASASLFRVTGARPVVGTLFGTADETRLRGPVVVLAEGLWRRRYGGSPGVIGRLVELDGEAYSVLGVLPDDLAYPDRRSKAWVPMQIPPAAGNYLSLFNAVALLAPGATPGQAAEEATARARTAPGAGLTGVAIFGADGPITVSARPLGEAVTADVRQPILVLLAAVALLLATTMTNVASVQLARYTARLRELAIRAALGAGTARVVRQSMLEMLLLAALGSIAGLVLVALLHRAVPILLPPDFPRTDDLRLDLAVVAFAAVVTALAGIVCGLIPALRIRRFDLVSSLAEYGSTPLGAGDSSRTVRVRLLLMGGQVAAASLLLVGAALLGRSFVGMLQADRGFDPGGVVTARLPLPEGLYTPERRHLVLEKVLERLARTPGIEQAAFTSETPLAPGGSTSAFTFRRPDDGMTIQAQASPRVVSERYFDALRIRIVGGRGFARSDSAGEPPVAVVNRAFARRYCGGNALGARVPMALGYTDVEREATIVGVVDDVRYVGAGLATMPEIYYSYAQLQGRLVVPMVTLMVRAVGDPATVVPFVRTAVRDGDPQLVPDGMMTLGRRLMTTLARPRFYAVLLGGFAALALTIAAVGLFGVLSYGVTLRARELALRAALGAQRRDLVGLVLRQALVVTTVGLALGLAAAFVVSRSFAALLYGVAEHDGATYIAAAVIVLVVALGSCLGPARRAARLDPLQALRR